MKIAAIALALLLVGHGPKAPSCVVVVPLILLYGEPAAVAWAKSRGYSDAQIADVKKRCGKYMR